MLLTPVVLHRIDGAFEIGREVGFAGIVAANHIDQVVVHDGSVKTDLIQGFQHIDQVVIPGVRECFTKAAGTDNGAVTLRTCSLNSLLRAPR